MIDLSNEPLIDNINTCKKHLQRLEKIDMSLEIGCSYRRRGRWRDSTHIETSKLYTQPEEVAYAYENLIRISTGLQ